MKTTTTNDEATLVAMAREVNRTQAAHAKLLRWNAATSDYVATCDEVTLRAAYVAMLQAERAYLAACGETHDEIDEMIAREAA